MTEKPSSPEFNLQRLPTPKSRESPQPQPMRESANRTIPPLVTEYPAELPITGMRAELLELIGQHQVVIVCGETGSGKSTQLPKLLWELGYGRDRMIGHTQPRRLAARTIATRLAEEMQTPLGQGVGFQIRFGDQTSDQTCIKLMTDGILLAETQTDRRLNRYDAIIIDEAHERSLNIDFLLGFLSKLRYTRPDLRLIITSATIDADRFANHFANDEGPAPILTVQGRSYPVEIRYLPWEKAHPGSRQPDLGEHVTIALESLGRLRGDVLVFLPTERDIRETSHHVAGHYRRLGMHERYECLPLYARLPTSEQQKIFHPTGQRTRIVFATNVAESSLTVPGIHYVIDAGTARTSRYSARSKMQRLPIEPTSQASANQRAGRCGRIGPGICIRLYSSADFDAREPFTTPEIQRTNLASAVLRLKALDLGSLEDFPLIDAPRPELVREGIRTLFEIGAIDHRQSLTPIGKRLGRLPVDPRVGRMLIAAQEQGVLSEMLPIAAALEVQDPRDRPPEQRAEADAAHAKFMDPRSDFLAFLRIWRYYEQAKANFSRSRLTRELKANFLSPLRMFEWFDVYRQLKEMMLAENERDHSVLRMRAIRYCNDPDKVVSDDVALDLHRSLLTGLLSGVAMRDDKSQYTGCGGLKLFLWPGSGTMVTKPKWIVAAELVETSRQYARTVAQIQPQWLEKIADHLIKRSYSDSHWSSKLAGAFCYEQQTLFGLPIVTRLRVPLARIDPGGARDLLIDHGLVEEDLLTHAKAILFNRQLCAWIAQLAAKTRQRDWVVDPYRLRQLYQERLPEDIVDRARLEKYDRQLVVPDWTKRVRSDVDVATFLADGPPRSEPSLYFRPDDIVDVQEDQLQENDFPDELGVGASRLPLTYRFEPGTETDGIEIKVHASALSQISDEALGWLVPGMLHEKVVCMIKALPKRIRRNLVPTADVAKQVVAELTPLARQKPFLPSLCTVLTKHAEQSVAPEDFQQAKLPLHLRFLITIVDDDGNTIAQSRDVTPLQKQLGQTNSPVDESVPEDDAVWWRERMTSFEIERLPAEVVRRRGGVQVAQFPGLVDAGDAVTMKLFADAPSAEYHTRSAIVRLYALREKRELKSQVRWLPSLTESRVRLSTIMPTANIEQSLADLIARLAFVEQRPLVRTQEEFESRLRATGPAIGEATSRVAPWLSAFATAVFDTQQALESMPRSRHESTLADVRDQVAQLVFPEFWSRVPWEWLSQYPRYFRGIHYRLDKIRTGAAVRDGEALKTVVGLRQRWLNRLAEEIRGPELTCDQEFRWWLEELRVSLFAQPLGTIVKISPQRCEKWLQS